MSTSSVMTGAPCSTAASAPTITYSTPEALSVSSSCSKPAGLSGISYPRHEVDAALQVLQPLGRRECEEPADHRDVRWVAFHLVLNRVRRDHRFIATDHHFRSLVNHRAI